ncbi:putative translation elongation factor G [Catonella morbi ATCC 51271]|uniref:Putative translation elongation factor G n=1 Tax=Catonella morbi ATCC 51271 TaxID=592026 RepID=V2XQI3_9FIRM|nr:elongation factor G [Catonella morbi]ESL04459.1 putative translation elongation factor G [Catonella morbi ATCC 51271]
MDIFKYERIRNVALLGHGSCGKTTLAEAMAFVTGVISRPGKIEDGSTISDYDKEEQKRTFSIHTSVIPIVSDETKINILDTPGYFDFVGEAEEAVSAADAAIIVISAKAGVQVGTEKAWNLCEKYKLPRMFFVTDMDDDNASYRKVVEALQELYGTRVAPFQLPIRENEKFVGFVNVVKMAGRRFNDDGTYIDSDIPDYSMEYLQTYRDALLEAVAETSDDMMDKFFNGEEFTQAEMSTALRKSVGDSSLVPVLMGSGTEAKGVRNLIDQIVNYFPSPNKTFITGINQKTGESFHADYDENKEMTAKVFKTIADPFIGKFSLIKICSGVLKADSTIYNVAKDTEEKISRLYVLRGKEQIEVKELHAGDIGAIGKLDIATGDSIATKAVPVVYDKPTFTVPYTYMRYVTKNKGDDDKIASALAKIVDEDPTIKLVNDSANRQSLIYGIGDQQLDVVVSKLANRYKVEIELLKPRIPYKETIKKKVSVQNKYKKQTGGHGQYGDVHITFEPSNDLEKQYIFEETVFGGAIPKNFFPAIEKGIAECVAKGPLAGYPVVGLKATLTDGSYHPVDSSEMAFKTAAIQAFKDGFMQAMPILLEPIVTLRVVVPDEFTGDVMGDLNKRRGRVSGMNTLYDGRTEILDDIPQASLLGYSTDLRSMTGGIGEYSYEFSHYEAAPADVQAKVVEENAANSGKED